MIILSKMTNFQRGYYRGLVEGTSDGRFPYSKSKIEIFPRIEKNRNLDFITSFASIFIDVEYIYIRLW